MTQQAYPIRCRIRDEGGDVTRVDVYDDIGPGGWFSDGLTAKDFAAQLAKSTGALEIHVSSGGGDVFDGIAIANTIRSYQGTKTTVNDGIAASIASVIFQAGDERVVQPGAMVMIHDAFGMVLGNAAEARKFADTLDQVSDNIAGIYAGRAGGTRDQWRGAMREETWYTADEAVVAGLADRVGDGAAQLPAGMDLAAFTAVPGRIAAALRKMPQAKAPAETVTGSGGGGGGSTNLTVTAGSPGASYTIGSGSSNTSLAANGGAGGTAPVVTAADGGPAPEADAVKPGRKKDKKATAKKAGTRKAAAGKKPRADLTLDAIRAVIRDEIRRAGAAAGEPGPEDKPDDAGDHTHTDLTGINLEQIRAALKGANE